MALGRVNKVQLDVQGVAVDYVVGETITISPTVGTDMILTVVSIGDTVIGIDGQPMSVEITQSGTGFNNPSPLTGEVWIQADGNTAGTGTFVLIESTFDSEDFRVDLGTGVAVDTIDFWNYDDYATPTNGRALAAPALPITDGGISRNAAKIRWGHLSRILSENGIEFLGFTAGDSVDNATGTVVNLNVIDNQTFDIRVGNTSNLLGLALGSPLAPVIPAQTAAINQIVTYTVDTAPTSNGTIFVDGVEVSVLSTDTAAAVAAKIETAYDAIFTTRTTAVVGTTMTVNFGTVEYVSVEQFNDGSANKVVVKDDDDGTNAAEGRIELSGTVVSSTFTRGVHSEIDVPAVLSAQIATIVDAAFTEALVGYETTEIRAFSANDITDPSVPLFSLSYTQIRVDAPIIAVTSTITSI